MIFKDAILKIRISSETKSKLISIAQKKKTNLTRLIESEIDKIIKKEHKNESN
jgi:hypothetical protein